VGTHRTTDATPVTIQLRVTAFTGRPIRRKHQVK